MQENQILFSESDNITPSRDFNEESLPSEFDYSNSFSDSSEDETLFNRALPNTELQGYTIFGKPIPLAPERAPGELVDRYKQFVDNPELLFQRVTDDNTGREKLIPKEMYEKFLNMMKTGQPMSGIDVSDQPHLKFIKEQRVTSIKYNIVPKKSKLTKRREIKKMAIYAKQIMRGDLDPDDFDGFKKMKAEYERRENEICDLWVNQKVQNLDELDKHGLLSSIPPPKMSLPETKDSYNPPDEYLQENQSKIKKLRQIRPKFKELLQERFERQLDLYLAPRQRKTEEDWGGSAEEYLDAQLKHIQDLNLRPYPAFCNLVIRGATGAVNSVDVSPNGRFVAAGGKDGIVRVYELQTGKMLKQTYIVKYSKLGETINKYYYHEINCLRFCPRRDVCILAVACANQIVFIDLGFSFGESYQTTRFNTRDLLNVDIETCKPAVGFTWECIKGVVQNSNGAINIVDAEKQDEEGEVDDRVNWQKFQLNHDGKPDNLTIYQPLNDQVQLRIHCPLVINQIDWHKTGDYILATSRNTDRKSNISLHRLSTGQTNIPFETAMPVRCAIFHPKNAAIVVLLQHQGFTFDLKKQQKENDFFCDIGQINRATFSDHLYVTGGNGQTCLLRYGAGPRPDSRNAFASISQQAIASDGNGLIAIGGDDGVIQVVRNCDGKLVACQVLKGHGVKNQIGVTDVRFGSCGHLVSSCGDGTVRVWL